MCVCVCVCVWGGGGGGGDGGVLKMNLGSDTSNRILLKFSKSGSSAAGNYSGSVIFCNFCLILLFDIVGGHTNYLFARPKHYS